MKGKKFFIKNVWDLNYLSGEELAIYVEDVVKLNFNHSSIDSLEKLIQGKKQPTWLLESNHSLLGNDNNRAIFKASLNEVLNKELESNQLIPGKLSGNLKDDVSLNQHAYALMGLFYLSDRVCSDMFGIDKKVFDNLKNLKELTNLPHPDGIIKFKNIDFRCGDLPYIVVRSGLYSEGKGGIYVIKVGKNLRSVILNSYSRRFPTREKAEFWIDIIENEPLNSLVGYMGLMASDVLEAQEHLSKFREKLNKAPYNYKKEEVEELEKLINRYKKGTFTHFFGEVLKEKDLEGHEEKIYQFIESRLKKDKLLQNLPLYEKLDKIKYSIKGEKIYFKAMKKHLNIK